MHRLVNKILKRLNAEFHLIWFRIVTLFQRMYLWLIGVNIGKQSSFRGWCSFFLSDQGKIVIGKKAVFNSHPYTNHIGLNHRCIVTTFGQGTILIGDNCGMSSTTITAFKSVVIGNNVRIGANCVIMDGDYHLDDPRTSQPKPIIIGDGVWLGYGVMVMKGVKIGQNTIVGANSIITSDLPANCVAVGSPCKPIKYFKS